MSPSDTYVFYADADIFEDLKQELNDENNVFIGCCVDDNYDNYLYESDCQTLISSKRFKDILESIKDIYLIGHLSFFIFSGNRMFTFVYNKSYTDPQNPKVSVSVKQINDNIKEQKNISAAWIVNSGKVKPISFVFDAEEDKLCSVMRQIYLKNIR
jgi:hypothetical protein